VIFWLYGGLQFGTSMQFLYDGSAFAANQDVIMVATNYRTKDKTIPLWLSMSWWRALILYTLLVFGFPGSPELPKEESNLGFIDQRAALQRVHRNIKAFGGDPNKITILGQSAGVWSVDALLTSYTENPPFHAAILQSGQFSYKPANLTGDVTSWNALAAALGCADQVSKLACLRTKSVADIRHIVDSHALSFYPIPDNLTLVEQPGRARAAGHFARVPVMCGTTGQEARDFEVTKNNTHKFLEGVFSRLAPQIISSVAKAYRQTGYDVNTEILTGLAADCVSSSFEYSEARTTSDEPIPSGLGKRSLRQ
jgi:acetylcholinesterase